MDILSSAFSRRIRVYKCKKYLFIIKCRITKVQKAYESHLQVLNPLKVFKRKARKLVNVKKSMYLCNAKETTYIEIITRKENE